MAGLRRLIDLPEVAALEYKALLKSRMGDEDARPEFPEIDEAVRAATGLTPDEADEIAHPADWDNIQRKPLRQQVGAFEAEGWDVTDDKRRPLRTLVHFAHPLWLAIRGVAGEIPFQPEDEPDPGASSLAREAARFRRDRR